MPGRRDEGMKALLAEAAADLPAEPVAFPRRESPPAVVSAVPAEAVKPTPRPVSRPPRKPRTAGVTESQVPLWQRLERKELRLRADQLDELARLRRALNRQRGGAGERITENTLIRVAVDMLLGQSGRLAGTTEEELRDSVTP